MTTSIKKGMVFLTVSSIIFVLAGYAVNLWLGRYLGPSAYGVYGIVISLMTMVNLVQSAGLPQAVSKYIAEDEKREDQILKKGLILQICSTLVIASLYFLLATPISNLLDDVNLAPYIRMSAFILPFYGVFNLYVGYYNGLHRFGRQALMSVFYSVVKVIAVIGLSYAFHLYGALSGFIIAPFIALLAGLRLPAKTKSFFPYKKLILFSLPLIGYAFFSTLLQSIDLYFIKALLPSDKDPGYYTASQNIARISFFGLSAFSVVLFPSIAKSVGEKTIEKTRKLIHESLRYVLMLLLPATLLISATSKHVLELLYSRVYLPAQESLSILVIGFAFLTIFGVLANILNGAGFPKLTLFIAIFGVCATTILCLILIPSIGLPGAAWATTIGSLTSLLLASYFVYQRFRQLIAISSLLRISASSLLVYILARSIQLPTLLLPVEYLLLFILHIAVLVIIREISRDDWDRVRTLLPG